MVKNFEETVIRMLGQIQQDVTELKERVGALEVRMDRLEERMDKLEERMDALEADVAKMKEQIKNTQVQIKNMTADIQELQTKQVATHDLLDQSITDMAPYIQQITHHELRLDQHGRRLIRLEKAG